MTTGLRNNELKLSSQVQVMGILNVTPDSFSDGGNFTKETSIIQQVEKMISDGADIIDVGGESTRPFAEKIDQHQELQRVLPAVRVIHTHFPDIPISIDTTKAEVARQACDSGASIINDISALRFDPAMINVALEFKTPIIIMHMQGTPGDMQKNPVYNDVVEDIIVFFKNRLEWMAEQGIPRDRVTIDPGIGFGKTVEHNLTILNRLNDFAELGCPILVGHSRKSFLDKILNLKVDERDLATATVSALCVAKGANILRVHDVNGTMQAIKITQAILQTNK